MPAPRKYSEEEIKTLRGLRLQGHSIKECAKLTGIGFGSCRVYLKDIVLDDSIRLANLRKVKGAVLLGEEQERQICQDYLQLKSAQLVADKHAITKSKVKRTLLKYGTTLSTEDRSAIVTKALNALHESSKGTEVRRSMSNSQTARWLSASESQKGKQVLALRESYEKWLASLTPEARLSFFNGRSQSAKDSQLRKNGAESWDEYFGRLAAARNTVVLSKYIGTFDGMDFRCSNGHDFSMRANNFQQGQGCPTCSAGRHASKAQLEILEYIQRFYPSASSVVLDGVEYDVFVPELNFAVEYNGLVWHSEKVTEMHGNDVSGRHNRKWKSALVNDVKLLAIFEDEWRDKRALVEAMIRWRLGVFSGQKLDARKLSVKRLEKNKDFEAFFDRNHLDGHTRANYGVGLFLGDKLVSCMSFRTNFNKEFEIARFATDIDYSVRGAAGRLLGAVDEKKIYTFSNNRLSHGSVYEKLGFQLVDESRPSYWYTDGHSRVWRFNCRRDNTPEIIAMFPTEKAQALGGVFSKKLFGDERPLYKIEDYGHRKWVSER